MERYLIKSLKWTKHNKVETWWGPDRNGYTRYIYSAGIYTEEDKKTMNCLVEEKTIQFIVLTEKLIKKGIRQLKKEVDANKAEIKRHEKVIAQCTENIRDWESKIKEMNEKFDLVKI